MALFQLGHCVITPAAASALAEARLHPIAFLARHGAGDWGVVGEDDRRANAEALASDSEERIVSAYELPTGVRIWVITERDRSSTLILLPSDY